MKCKRCGAETFLPFTCPYCGGSFCAEHRLPENHACERIDLARLPKEEAAPVVIQQPKSYEYSVSYASPRPVKGTIRFSSKEIGHLAVAALLVIGVGLSLVWLSSPFTADPVQLISFVLIFAVSFFTHEFAHKIAAQRSGFWAEFRLTLWGALLTFVSVVSPFKIISPGAVMISGAADRKTIGKISIAGPLTNIVLSLLFLGLSLLPFEFTPIFLLGTAFNAWIALFNLIPFGIFDGFKIFVWDKRIWALAFAVSLILTLFSYGVILA